MSGQKQAIETALQRKKNAVFCHDWQTKELQNSTSVVFVKWGKCDFCDHLTHLQYCTPVRVLRRGDTFKDTKSTLVLDAVLQHVTKLLSNTLFLFGLRSEVLDQLISHRSSAYRVSTDGVIMNMQLENISQIPIPNRLTVTNLKQKHVETVVQEWPYSGIFSDCKEWVSDMIKQNPSVCIENEQRDPVAWILQQDYGCIGMLHVIPEYRRAKLGSAVTMLLMEKLLKEEDYLYSAVNLDNKPSLAFHERNNFEYVSDFSVGFVVYPYEDGLQK
uniref:N-acetyltransferase domain-containing protein n=1 Tax=Magallana gigas TaxID=29159 RepID=A0A8W8N8J7_MAGGI